MSFKNIALLGDFLGNSKLGLLTTIKYVFVFSYPSSDSLLRNFLPYKYLAVRWTSLQHDLFFFSYRMLENTVNITADIE